MGHLGLRVYSLKGVSGNSLGANGKISATIGGQPFGNTSPLNWLGNLQTSFNNPKDSLSNSATSQTVTTPSGMTDTKFINNLIDAAKKYQNDLNYDLFPESGSGYNSNSYVAGILKAAGATPPTLRQVLPDGGTFRAPGYSKPIP
jgi:hypothetical protein